MKTINYFTGFALFAVVAYFLFKRVSSQTSGNAFKMALNRYPLDVVRNAERIYRLETSHFKSEAYKLTSGAGFEAFAASFPFGWGSLRELWQDDNIRPSGFIIMAENVSGIDKKFVVFPSLYAGVLAVCQILKNRGNNPARIFQRNRKNNKNIIIIFHRLKHL